MLTFDVEVGRMSFSTSRLFRRFTSAVDASSLNKQRTDLVGFMFKRLLHSLGSVSALLSQGCETNSVLVVKPGAKKIFGRFCHT